MEEYTQTATMEASLPAYSRLPINRCNLPALILGSLTFQQHPVDINIDGVTDMHKQLFEDLDGIKEISTRVVHFNDYMRASFLLDNPEQVGQLENSTAKRRDKADYLKLLRGWHFDPNSQEAAVMKGWVESRFGLMTLNHRGPITDFTSTRYASYQHSRCLGLYNTNALEAQLDLLYSFTQYELARRYAEQSHCTLYRGFNRLSDHEVLTRKSSSNMVILLNNLNSFTLNKDRADEFGDLIMTVEIPHAKILFFPDLLPGCMKGEEEYLVIGGAYEINVSSYLG
jgi:NAD+---dinitrogen-reductase ADP-D-ribosyltransferase